MSLIKLINVHDMLKKDMMYVCSKHFIVSPKRILNNINILAQMQVFFYQMTLADRGSTMCFLQLWLTLSVDFDSHNASSLFHNKVYSLISLEKK